MRRHAALWLRGPVAEGGYGFSCDRFPDFESREFFNFDAHPHWFAGHMNRARTTLEKKLKDVDILLEVRDARAPFTTAQVDLTKIVGNRAKRLVVLNKADLITPNVGLAMRSVVEETGLPCLLTNASENKNLIKIKHFALENAKADHPRTLGLMLMVIGLPNVGKSTVINGLKSLAFSTARAQGKESKLVFGVNHTKSRVTKVPGETKIVGFFQLSNRPRLYCYDTPGVSLLKRRNDPERNAKLALLQTMPDHFAGEMYLADYLLYRLNRDRLLDYVDVIGLPGPTDDVRYLTSFISGVLAQKRQLQVYSVEVMQSARFFLQLFRAGSLGKICLDHIPGREEVRRLRQLRAETEPPGPWGPPCYPEVPAGLELGRSTVLPGQAEPV